MTVNGIMEKWFKLEIQNEDGRVVGFFFAPDDWAPEEPEPELDEIVYVAPQFKLGVSSEDPSLGSGLAYGWYTKDVFKNGTRINLQVYVKSAGGSSGIGSGSYELHIPEEIRPAQDYYSGNANLYLAGGGRSIFDGSIKWNDDDGKSDMKLVFSFEGAEWTRFHPKNYADFKLRASIEYYL